MEIEVHNIIVELAEKKDIRLTYQREKILKILIENKYKHLTVGDIYCLSQQDNHPIALPTIYRTLDMLEKNGIITKNDFGDGAARYEFKRTKNEIHHHLICEKCGKIIHITGLLPSNLSELLMKEKGFQSKYQSLKIYGLCQECLKLEGA